MRVRPQFSGRFAVCLALVAVMVALASCEIITHAHDYGVAPEYQGYCNACPSTSLDLRHAPCPTGGDVPDDGQTHVYAAREVYFAAPEDELYTGTFDLGYDLDCSDRPEGVPVRCQARVLDEGESLPWKALPHGIDNSLVQRIFAPLYAQAAAAGQDINLNAQYTDDQVSGRVGMLVIVDHWNGTPDDPSVYVSILSSPGVSDDNGAPRWDGTDRWDRYADEPGNESKYFKLESAEGYVSEGTLVVDYRSRGDVSFRFGSPQLSFRIIINQVVFIGALNREQLSKFTMVAVADVASTLESVPEVASVLASCNAAGEAYLNSTLPRLLVGAADMPRNPSAPPEVDCDGISFSWALDGYPARMGEYKALSSADPDAGCL